jgi:cytidylate kinase
MSNSNTSIEKLLARQAHLFELQKSLQKTHKSPPAPFITISRAFGCSGFGLGNKLLERLNVEQIESQEWSIYDRRIFDCIDGNPDLCLQFFESHIEKRRFEFEEYLNTTLGTTPSDLALFKRWASAMCNLATTGRSIFVGRASWLVTKHLEHGIHLRIDAPLAWRAERYAMANGLESGAALTLMKKKDQERQNFISRYFSYDPDDYSSFHLVLNNARLSESEMVEVILQVLKSKNTT